MKTRIYKPHTHAGKRYTPGPEGIEVDLSDAAIAWLKAHNPHVLEKPKAHAAHPHAAAAPPKA